MFLPVVQMILLLIMAVISALKDQLGDPAAQWAKTAHLLVLGAALLLSIVVLYFLNNATTPAGAKAICDILVPCITPTP